MGQLLNFEKPNGRLGRLHDQPPRCAAPGAGHFLNPAYLLDTKIAIHLIKGTVPATDRWMATVPPESVFLSAVTEAELRHGLAKLPKAIRLNALVEKFLSVVKILPWGSDAATHYGILRATLEREGMVMGNLDMMIAAHALSAGTILATHDGAFERVKDLRVSDWTKSPPPRAAESRHTNPG